MSFEHGSITKNLLILAVKNSGDVETNTNLRMSETNDDEINDVGSNEGAERRHFTEEVSVNFFRHKT